MRLCLKKLVRISMMLQVLGRKPQTRDKLADSPFRDVVLDERTLAVRFPPGSTVPTPTHPFYEHETSFVFAKYSADGFHWVENRCEREEDHERNVRFSKAA